MHLILPTSFCARGESNRAILSVVPVLDPGFSTDDPENSATGTSFPWWMARPTSRVGLTGSPMRIVEGLDLGVKRTRPGAVSYRRKHG